MTCIMLALSCSMSAQTLINKIYYSVSNENEGYVLSCESNEKTITIPAEVKINNKKYKVTSICESAFKNRSALQEITLPETIDEIGMDAFQNCKSLKKIVLPKNLKILGQFAFDNCSSLTSVTLSANLLKLDEEAFWGCNNIKTIIAIQTDPIVIFDSSFTKSVHKNARLIVPNGCADKYRKTKGWDLFTNIEEQTSGINRLKNDAAANSNASASFNLAGQKVNASYKGIVVKNGKKVINK